MQTKITASAFFMTCVLIGSCGVTKPYVDTRREAGKSKPFGESTPDNVVICYNSLSSTAEEIKNLARDECAKTGRKPVFTKQKSFSCTVLLPMRAYFKCEEKTAEDIAKEKAVSEKENKITATERLQQIRAEIKAKQAANGETTDKEKKEDNKTSSDNDNTPEQLPGFDTDIMEDEAGK